jgi:hypothetical protein
MYASALSKCSTSGMLASAGYVFRVAADTHKYEVPEGRRERLQARGVLRVLRQVIV